MRVLRMRLWVFLGVLLLVAVIGAGIAIAVTTSTTLADTNAVRLKIVRSETTGDFSSGWHTHPGPVIVQVQEGFLKISQQGNCQPNVVGAGETFIEVPELPLVAEAKGPAKWTTTFILPNSSPGGPDRTNVPPAC